MWYNSKALEKWPVGQASKTLASHAGNMGSIPVRVTKKDRKHKVLPIFFDVPVRIDKPAKCEAFCKLAACRQFFRSPVRVTEEGPLKLRSNLTACAQGRRTRAENNGAHGGSDSRTGQICALSQSKDTAERDQTVTLGGKTVYS